MYTKDNYVWLDRFRLAAALLVIAIHTSPLDAFSPEGDFFLTRILARIAVPFFFMVTGQFVVRKFTDSTDPRQSLLRYLRKILVYYAVSILLYLPIGIYAGHYKDMTVPSVLRMLLFDGTFYHLWYFPACLLGMVLVFLMSRFLKLRGVIAVSAALYATGLLGDSYFGLVQKLPPVETVYGLFFQVCSYTRNGLFFAPLFLTLGAWSAGKSRRGISAHLAALALSFPLMTAEAFTLRHFAWQRHDSMYLLLVPVTLSLYRVLQCLPGAPGRADRHLRTASLWIYILHPAFIIVLRGAAKALRLTPLLVDNSLVHYLAVSALSVGAGFGIAFVTRHFPAFPGNAPAVIRQSKIAGDRLPSCPTRNLRMPPRTDTGLKHLLFRSQPSPFGRAWIELDGVALAQNVEYLRSLMPPDCRLMPAVKANAYGHGAVWTARELNRLGVDAFCVACVSEGISLRRANVKGEILILGYTAPEDFGLLTQYRLAQTIVDYEHAEKLDSFGQPLHVHIGIDTGMHRLGIRCEEVENILAVFEKKHLIIDGMFTHLCACDSHLPEKESFTADQVRAFYRVAEILDEQGIPCPMLHLQSSYGLLNYPSIRADYVRAGIALYGVPSSLNDQSLFQDCLAPVLSLKARISSVRTVYSGESAGYGLAFTAERDMRIAVLAIGYADGLPRELSCGKGYVLVHGRKAPVIGRICMDQTLVDVSGIPQVAAGDTAVLIGSSGEEEISAARLAAQCGTIANELLSRLGERLERVECGTFPSATQSRDSDRAT